MTIQHSEPDFDKAIEECRGIMELLLEDDYEANQIEIRLQHIAASLGRNPALVYPDYDERIGPEYWYICRENKEEHSLVFSKSEDDWVCPVCHL